MPRKAKEEIVENEVIDEKKKSVKKTASKKTATKKTDNETKKVKKAETKKEDDSTKKAKKTTTKKAKEEKVEEAPKKVKTTKKTTVKKAESKPAKTKTTTAKKKEASVKTKSTTKKKASPSKSKSIEVKEDNTTSKTKPATTKKKTATKAKSSDTKKTATSTKATKTTKSSKTTSAKKTTTRKKSTKTTEPAPFIVEYYDLPLKYGDTIVKLLAQTPKTLFVYWEVSDSDIANFKKEYGEDFFNKTKPFLIVHNITLNKTTEIEINDFANCWYLNTDDTDCKFDIELVRKFIDNTPSTHTDDQDYLYIAKSNDLNSPNNHILFEKIQEFVVFRNTTNDNVIKKNIKSFKFLKDIYKFYKDMYDEDILNNPSSQFKF